MPLRYSRLSNNREGLSEFAIQCLLAVHRCLSRIGKSLFTFIVKGGYQTESTKSFVLLKSQAKHLNQFCPFPMDQIKFAALVTQMAMSKGKTIWQFLFLVPLLSMKASRLKRQIPETFSFNLNYKLIKHCQGLLQLFKQITISFICLAFSLVYHQTDPQTDKQGEPNSNAMLNHKYHCCTTKRYAHIFFVLYSFFQTLHQFCHFGAFKWDT